MTSSNDVLTDADYDKLTVIMERIAHKGAMNLEMTDGFFAALICSPELVLPNEYLPELLGSQGIFYDMENMNEFMSLAMRHWNTVSGVLQSGEVYLPLLLENDEGGYTGNDWASGFMRGMKMRQPAWNELVDNEEEGGALVPIFALYYEHDEDPEMRPYKEPVSDELRQTLVAGAAAGVMRIYEYFEPHRRGDAEVMREGGTYRRSSRKIGRNEPCPCGSGKKYKKCCGSVMVH